MPCPGSIQLRRAALEHALHDGYLRRGHAPSVRLRETLHVERLPVASQGVGEYGAVRPHRQAVVAIKPPRQVLCQPAVVAVAAAVALGVCGVGVRDLAGRYPSATLISQAARQDLLNLREATGLIDIAQSPLELLRELTSPVGFEAVAFPFVSGFPRGGRRGG